MNILIFKLFLFIILTNTYKKIKELLYNFESECAVR